MAIKGLSKPICSTYQVNGNVVTYSEPYTADYAVEYSFEAEIASDNDLYADNNIKESAAGKFASGSLTLKTADLTPSLSKKIIGLRTVTRTVAGKEVTEAVYDDNLRQPDLGFGIIEEHEIDGITKYLPIIFPKIKFNVPGNAATTRGNEIEWQTREVTAKVMRSDQVDENYNHPWQISPEELYDTEAEAEEYIKAVLSSKEEDTGGTVPEENKTEGIG